jgi:transposase, IS6 family
MRGLKQLRSIRVICVGQAFVQNVRRGHYELGSDTNPKNLLATAFTELAFAI